MIFRALGEVVPGFHVLGHPAMPSYLLQAESPALFDAGVACLATLYSRGVREALGSGQPDWLFLTHAHYDHIGAAELLREDFPGLKVAAAPRAGEIVQNPRAVALIEKLNHDACRRFLEWGAKEMDPRPFRPFRLDKSLADDEEVDLGGGLTVRAIHTPGHTRDHVSYYIPERRILVAGEAAGCMESGGRIITEFLVSYDNYLAANDRLAVLPVEVYCQCHGVVFTGDDARSFLSHSRRAALRYREMVDRFLDQEKGDIDKVMQRVKAEEYDSRPDPKQPLPAYLLNLRARVEHLAGLRQTG